MLLFAYFRDFHWSFDYYEVIGFTFFKPFEQLSSVLEVSKLTVDCGH